MNHKVFAHKPIYNVQHFLPRRRKRPKPGSWFQSVVFGRSETEEIVTHDHNRVYPSTMPTASPTLTFLQEHILLIDFGKKNFDQEEVGELLAIMIDDPMPMGRPETRLATGFAWEYVELVIFK